MTHSKRMRIAVLAMICSACIAPQALAAGPQALSAADAQRYAAAFQAVDSGDFIDAEVKVADIKDKSLLGVLSFRRLMHPTATRATFDELADWLARYRDLPLAGRVFALAARRKPAGALPPPQPLLSDADWNAPAAREQARPVSEKGRQAREAFYGGDVQRALDLAPAAGEPWIAGMAAYRLKNYAAARGYFEQVMGDAVGLAIVLLCAAQGLACLVAARASLRAEGGVLAWLVAAAIAAVTLGIVVYCVFSVHPDGRPVYPGAMMSLVVQAVPPVALLFATMATGAWLARRVTSAR